MTTMRNRQLTALLLGNSQPLSIRTVPIFSANTEGSWWQSRGATWQAWWECQEKEHEGQKQRRGEPHTSPFPLSDWGIVADAHHLCGAPRSGTLARLPYHISERELHVFLGCLQSKKLSVEEHEGVEKDKGRIDPQLLALPEVFFLHTGEYSICDGQREKQRGAASQTHLSSYTYTHLAVGFLLHINPDV